MMKLVLAVMLITLSGLYTVNGFYIENESYNPFIIGGQNATRGEFPCMVSIQRDNKHQCGGAIVSPTWIVSAAHCFFNITGYSVVAGMIDLKESHSSVQKIPVVKLVRHPDFSNNLNYISLIQLATLIVFNEYVRPIALPKPNEVFDGRVTVSGWGHNIKFLETLQYLELSLISIDECNAVIKKLNSYPRALTEANVCALPDKLKQSGCHGDSGGPLAQNKNNGKVLVGIVHGGHILYGDNLKAPAPNIYTNVSYHIEFIEKYVDDLP